ncbi:MAG: methionyl-tRNA formyltransferase [Saprospiraceae bacterium]|nr:methionyl-tRNA formyltransferase [Saprospiraceae bacterium]
MGTPEFAVPSLDILLEHGYDVVAVVTAPDKPGGRLGIQESAVKKFAQSRGLTVLQPEKLKHPDFIETLRALKADLQIVVAFRMLPEIVWNMPPMGTMNLHGSLLPKYRGAAPINWAVINGEQETGLTTFLLQHEIDTGDLLMQEKVSIGPDETAGELHDRMMLIGAKLVLKSVQELENGRIKTFPQNDSEATHAPKIFLDTCRIPLEKSAQEVHNHIRGLSPYPGAWTTYDNKTVKVLRSALVSQMPAAMATLEPGAWYVDGKNQLLIRTGDGCISVLELQMEGKKRMAVRDFLNGFKLGQV